MMRLVVLSFGVVMLIATWFGPLPQMARGSFSAHMAIHMVIVAVAAPAVAIGMANTRLDPVRGVPGLFAAIPASIVELVIVWAWHTPGLHHVARHSTWGFVLEQGTFFVSGLFVWLAAFGGDGRAGQRTAAGIVALLLTSMHMTLLGALLALPPRPLYVHHTSDAVLTSLQDQHLGGAIMLVVGGMSYLLGGLGLTVRLLARARRHKRMQSYGTMLLGDRSPNA